MTTWKPITVFLSYASKDADRVKAIAEELQKRGVTPWVDRDGLYLGDDLDETLGSQIDDSHVVALCLSFKAAKSDWVNLEIERALALEDRGKKKHLVPVFWATDEGQAVEPEKVVKDHEALRNRWISVRTDKVNRKYVQSDDPAEIAEQLTKTALDNANLLNAKDVGIYLDIRGTGKRTGAPDLRKFEFAGIGVGQRIPLLLFRPDRGDRQPQEALSAEQVNGFVAQLKWGVETAWGELRSRRNVYVGGDAPLSVYWAVGRLFDRTTGITLYCRHSQSGLVLNDRVLRREVSPLASDDNSGKHLFYEDGAEWKSGPHKDLLTRGGGAVALAVFAKSEDSPVNAPKVANPAYLKDGPVADNSTYGGSLPLLWLPHPQKFADSTQTEAWIRDATAAVAWLKRQGVSRIVLYTSLLGIVLPLWSAQLSAHVAPPVTFMDWLKDPGADGRRYVAIDFAGGAGS